MLVQEVCNQTLAQFPLTVKFTPSATSPALLYVTASAWSVTPNQLIGVNVALDGAPLGSLMLFANEATSHKALVAMLFPVEFKDFSPHTLTFSAATPNTRCDVNDVVGAMLLMISDEPSFLWNPKGPIPQYTTMKSQVSGPALLFFSGSAYMNGGGQIGVEVVLNHEPVAISQIQAGSMSHTALPPRFTQIMLKYSEDPVQIGFSTNSGEVSSDQNDFFQLAVIY
jgi:hypothetical protein